MARYVHPHFQGNKAGGWQKSAYDWAAERKETAGAASQAAVEAAIAKHKT
jgi:hypothetical protein